MCPLYPFHTVLLYLCLVLPVIIAVVEGSAVGVGAGRNDAFAGWKLRFAPAGIEKLEEYDSKIVQFGCEDCKVPEGFPHPLSVAIINDSPDVAGVRYDMQRESAADEDDEYADEIVVQLGDHDFDKTDLWSLPFNVTGRFLGFARVRAEIRGHFGHGKSAVVAYTAKEEELKVSVTRKKTIQSRIFTASVATMISVAYINMGCAMDLGIRQLPIYIHVQGNSQI